MPEATVVTSCPLLAFLRSHALDRDEDTFDDEYVELQRLLQLEFGQCPFLICLDREDLLRLDEPLTPRSQIVVSDNRWRSNSATVVTVADNEPITRRRILHTIKHDPIYAEIAEQSDRIFLESIELVTPTRAACYFGS